MKLVIIKTVCELINGDRKVSSEKRITTDLEAVRVQIQKSTLNCKTVKFTYQELPD